MYKHLGTKKNKKYATHEHWPRVSAAITDYVALYWKYISNPGVYMRLTRDADDPARIVSHDTIPPKQMAEETSPYTWAFSVYKECRRSAIHSANRLQFSPNVGATLPDNAYNLFLPDNDHLAIRDAYTTDDKALLAPLLSFIRDYLCGGDPDDFAFLAKWQAHIFQHPDKKTQVAVILESEQEGTGKGFFAGSTGLLAKILGNLHVTCNGLEGVTGKFNSLLANKVIFVNAFRCSHEDARQRDARVAPARAVRRAAGHAAQRGPILPAHAAQHYRPPLFVSRLDCACRSWCSLTRAATT